MDNDASGATERDPRSLRALTHPTRWAIIDALVRETTATATPIAELIDEPVDSCSFRLRLRAKYGVIERVDSDDAHRHPWQFVQQRVDSNVAGDDDRVADARLVRLLATHLPTICARAVPDSGTDGARIVWGSGRSWGGTDQSATRPGTRDCSRTDRGEAPGVP